MHYSGVGYTFKSYSYYSGLKGYLEFLFEVITLPIYLWKRIRPFRGTIVLIEQAPAMSPGSWYCSRLVVKNWRDKEKSHFCRLVLFRLKPGDKVRRNIFAIVSRLDDKKYVRVKREIYV